MNLIENIPGLAGELRAKTFVAAAEFVCASPQPITLLETGCYRGSACDGQSTLILAMLAEQVGAKFLSYELHLHNIDSSRKLLSDRGLGQFANFLCGNSAETLIYAPNNICLAYLDSYDFEEHKAIDAQAHQLVEVGLLLPKMAPRSAFLIDDCDLPRGGKGGLSVPAIKACGYKEILSGYQKLLIRE